MPTLANLYVRAKEVVERTTGLRVYRASTPWGMDLSNDFRRALPGFDPQTIFDVGANVGQTALYFQTLFPKATIHSFEPVELTYHTLSANTAHCCGVRAHHLALGAVDEVKIIRIVEHSELSSFHLSASSEQQSLDECEEARVQRVDTFCREHAIQHIDLLKIDTEGHDLEVLKGTARMLQEGRVSTILVEVVISPTPHWVPIQMIVDFLGPAYRCIGLYGQQWWGTARTPTTKALALPRKLHYCNALFAKEELL